MYGSCVFRHECVERFSLVCCPLPTRDGDHVDFKLRTMLIETLFPLAKQSDGQPRCTSRDLSRPLFAGYLFANFRAAASLRAVAVSRGVLRVVSKNGAPLPVNESITTSLRQRVGPDGLIDLCESSTIPRNDLQAVPDPMEAWLSVFQPQLSDERRVEILVQILKGCPELRLNPEEKPMRSRAVPQRNSREGAIDAFPKTAPTV
jgi:transcription antitermination factor NusG